MKLVLKYFKRYRWLILLDLFSVSGFALAELGLPTLIGQMVDRGVEPGDAAALWCIFRILIVCCTLGPVGTMLLTWTSNKLSVKISADIRQDLFGHVMKLSHEQLEKFTVSSLITRTGSDSLQVYNFLNLLFRSAVMAPFMALCSVLLMIRTCLPLSWIVLGTIPLIILGVWIIFTRAGSWSEAQQKALDKINEILRENLSGIRVIRSFNQQRFEEQRFDAVNRRYRSLSEKLYKLMMMSDPMFFLLMNLAGMCMYWAACFLLQDGAMEIGQLISFSEYLFHTMMSVLVFCMVFVEYPRFSVSAGRILEVLQTKPSIDLNEEGQKAAPIESLEFDHVSFSYPGSDVHTLHDISFKAKKGQKIAVVGATGSGKSTLARLIPRFYTVSAGTIKINGVDAEQYDLKSLREQIGFISQKPHLFTGTIEDNLTFGKTELSNEDEITALQDAQALDFVQKRPKGLQDEIEEGGTNLSGGQKQRLSIARALAKKPGLYIFDDSFSALDFKTDAALRKALSPRNTDSIFLIVAQRISTVADADLILVLDHGKLAASGTHGELLKTSSLYREIVYSQMSEQEAMCYA